MLLEEAQRLVAAAPFARWWGLEVTSLAPVRVRLPLRPELLRPGEVLHGAAAMCVADVAVWVALFAEVPGGERAVTVHLATDYLAPARSDVSGEARLVKVGGRIAVGTCETRAADGTLVAFHTVTYALAPR